ncbi:MFS transporter [Solwaraspora sp. WMMD1047]|uniref:MFS transporter n=1 Tax=Solwaraspora sp. WMMD1047 TaxID=3016102 RepID=UPI0024174231|nr:MFS transporter [Solwaraspora sp. WMMD1047]MDG4829587.1 MFS transporter [Solwaraspora sp. WMMD1047]
MSGTQLRRLTLVERYLGRRGPGRTIAMAGFVDMLGAGLHLSVLPLYLVRFAGVSPGQVGLVVGASGVAALLAPYLAGYLADRASPLPVWRTTVALRMVGYGAFVLVDSLWSYALLALFLTPLDRATSNAQLSYLVAGFEADERNRTTAAVRTCRNAGLSVGLLVASLFLAVDTKPAYQAAFLVNAVSFLLLLGALARLPAIRRPLPAPAPQPAPPAPAPPARRAERPAPATNPWTDLRYLSLTAGDALMSAHTTVLFVVFPLWVATHQRFPAELLGILLALNSVATMALQPPLSELGTGLRNAGRLIRWAGAALLGCGALFWAASVVDTTAAAIALAVAAILALTLGENLQEVAVFEASHRLAPAAAIGRYLGVFSLGDSTQRIVGPSALTAVLVATPAGWAIFMAVTGLGALGVLRALGDDND